MNVFIVRTDHAPESKLASTFAGGRGQGRGGREGFGHGAPARKALLRKMHLARERERERSIAGHERPAWVVGQHVFSSVPRATLRSATRTSPLCWHRCIRNRRSLWDQGKTCKVKRSIAGLKRPTDRRSTRCSSLQPCATLRSPARTSSRW